MGLQNFGRDKNGFSSSIVVMYIPIFLFIVFSNKPAGDEYCFASNVSQMGTIGGFFENFKTNPFLLTSLIGTFQGLAILSSPFITAIAVGLLFSGLLGYLMTNLVESYSNDVSVKRYAYFLLFPIFVTGIASFNLVFDNRFLVFYSGWIASFIHLIPMLAILNLYLFLQNPSYPINLSTYLLILLSTNFGFITSSFAVGMLVFYLVRDLARGRIFDFFWSKMFLIILALSPLVLAFLSGAAGSRFVLATGREFKLSSKVWGLILDLPLIFLETFKIFLISFSLVNVLFIFFVGFHLRKTKFRQMIRPSLRLGSMGLAFSYSFTIALWESVSYPAWWHYAVVSLIQTLSLTSVFKDEIFEFLQNQSRRVIPLFWVLSLISILPGIINVMERQESWYSGKSYSIASLADYGTNWVDSCVSKIQK